jgi:hypothetical protein
MRRKLEISRDLLLPLEAVTQRFAFLGRTGAGKSYNAGVLFEEFVEAKQQAVVADPNGCWYGVRSSLNGKGPGLSVTIFGGEHADLPLVPSAGALVADMIIGERISAILDMSLFETDADEIRFMTAFADRLFRKNRYPMHFFIDEADTFAPESPLGTENVMLNRMARLAKRGRGRGIGMSLLSQRSAALSKRVLSQTEIMVALQTTDPRDRKAIKGWIEGKGTPEEQEMVLSTLASLGTGEAWVWSPAFLNLLKRIKFREKHTYDSGATPKVGMKHRPPKVLAQVDLERLKKHMSETIEKAKQEDPVALREEIRRLKTELARAAGAPRPAPTAPVAPRMVKTVEKIVEVPLLGKRELHKLEMLAARVETAKSQLGSVTRSLEGAAQDLRATVERMTGRKAVSGARTQAPAHLVKEKPYVETQRPAPSRPGVPSRLMPDKPQDQKLDKCCRAILSVLGQYPDGCLISKIALLAGYHQSGGFKNSLTILRTYGYMIGTNAGMMRITEDGLSAIDGGQPLQTGSGQDLANYWLHHPSFGLCERKILKSLLDSRNGLTLDEICQVTGYSIPASGGFKNSLTILRTAGVMIGRNTETMRLSEELLDRSLVRSSG